MKIWFAANITENSFGGVGRSMRGLASALLSRGHNVTIVYRASKISDNYLLFALYLLARFCVGTLDRPDWIIARSTDGVLCAIVIRVLRMKTKIALHNHGWEEHVEEHEKRLPRRLLTSPTTWKARWIRFSLLRATLALCRICICGTVWELRWLKRKYPSIRNRLSYVPNGVQTMPSAYWPNKASKPLHFLCIGAPTWKKNLEHSLRVFIRVRRRFPDAKLFLVGTGGASLKQCIPAGESAWSAISIIPAAGWDEMHTWYTTCPFLLSSSRFEGGHSLAILEAMSYGAVVFVSPIKSTLEFVRDGRNGCVISGSDVEADAARITGILAEPAVDASIRINAYMTSKRHGWTRQGERLEAALCRRM